MNPLNYFKDMGSEIMETEHGWANYIISGAECYIENIYVEPKVRKSGHATIIADRIAKIAKEKGCKYLTGSTNTKKPQVEQSMLALLGYGMKFLSSSENAIFYYKEL